MQILIKGALRGARGATDASHKRPGDADAASLRYFEVQAY